MTREEQDRRIEELEGWSEGDLHIHIVHLEDALRRIIDRCDQRTGNAVSDDVVEIARKALE